MASVKKVAPILKVENLYKYFGDFIANQNIRFDLLPGEIHCLLGENGAGKSTFAKCLYGAYRPDAGSIKINGEVVHFHSPRDAIHNGIGMVHQHFVLVPTMTVAENIVVGVERKGISPGIKEATGKIAVLSEKFGVSLDPHAVVSNLSVGEQQWVEILKSIFSGVDILILDEPTAALTPQESEQLFSIIKKMTDEGTSVIFITHKLNEVMAVSDRTTIFRKSKVVGTIETSQTDKMELATLMVGRGVHFEVDKVSVEPGEPILEIKDLVIINNQEREVVKKLSTTVRKNEILGIAGVGGNGQMELFDALLGVCDIAEGTITLDGEDLTNMSGTKIADKGLAGIPADRMVQGLMLDFTVAENLLLGNQRKKPFKSKFFLDDSFISKNAQSLISEYEVSTQGPKQIAGRLSGGNLQKLILAREFSRDIKCVIANCPTRGLDVGAIEYVHKRLVELRDQGIGVMLISEDLDEIFNVSDRVAVLFHGEIMGEFETKNARREQIGLLMAGVKEGDR